MQIRLRRPAIHPFTLWFIIAVAIAALAYWLTHHRRDQPLDRLRKAAGTLTARPMEGQLSGWPSVVRARAVGSADGRVGSPSTWRLRAVAGEILKERDEPHAYAVAALAVGDASSAIEEFRRAASGSSSPDFWNDYAVALLARAEEIDDPTLALAAAGACDHALALLPTHAAAHFNRGLSLTRLGLLAQAGTEFSLALGADRRSSWNAEARQRLAETASKVLDGWRVALPNIAKLDEASLDRLVKAYPQQARTYGEGICMTAWADAINAHDDAKARDALRLAQSIGKSLQKFSGETLLRDAVITADRSRASGTLETLASAYTTYRIGRIAYSKQKNAEGEVALRKAETLFSQAGSPMSLVSRYYTGSVLFSEMRVRESELLLDDLAASSPENRGYFALAAQIGWERGLCAAMRGGNSDAVAIFDRSRRLFDALGEKQFSATMSTLIASSLDIVSSHREAWRARRHAFESFSKAGELARIAPALTVAAANLRESDLDQARTLYGMAIDAATISRNGALTAVAYARRSTLERDENAARRDLFEAQRWARALPTPQPQADAEILFADGVLLSRRDPAAAANRFARAAAFYESTSRIELPRIQLARARAERALGNIPEARKQLAAGIEILESERAALRDIDQRATLFGGARPLFDEAIDLALLEGDVEGAFDLADRYRGRDLLDRFSGAPNAVAPMRPVAMQKALARGCAIVEYVILPQRVVAFVVRRDRLRAVVLHSTPASIERSVRLLMDAVKSNGDVIGAGSATYSDLMLPLDQEISDASLLVFVCPPELADLPFAALRDSVRGKFLIERTSMVMAPNASLAITASRRHKAGRVDSILAIGASLFDTRAYPDLQELPWAAQEAEQSAAAYPTAMVLKAEQATRERVLKEFGSHDVVHFAGHAVVPHVGDVDGRLLVAPSGKQAGEVRASEITELALRNVQLVVLAACRSGAASGQEAVNKNLANAFLSAGVTAVASTTTDLNDQAAFRIMLPFHRLVAKGRTANRALQEVLTAEIKNGRPGDPTSLSWTSIRLIGGSTDMVESR